MPNGNCAEARRPVSGIEVWAERPDGLRIPVLPHPTPLHDEDGELIGGIKVLVDITYVKDAELESARLAAIVVSSDELRNCGKVGIH